MMRRRREDRGKDDSIEIDLILDAVERIEVALKDMTDLLRDILEEVKPGA